MALSDVHLANAENTGFRYIGWQVWYAQLREGG